jgi:hypothetical protein
MSSLSRVVRILAYAPLTCALSFAVFLVPPGTSSNVMFLFVLVNLVSLSEIQALGRSSGLNPQACQHFQNRICELQLQPYAGAPTLGVSTCS